MGWEDIGDKLANRVIHVESLRYRGYWLDNHHTKFIAITSDTADNVYFKEWSQFKVHKVGDYVSLESLRFPNHYLDAHHTKWAGITYSNYIYVEDDWSLWKIYGKNGSLDECYFWSKRFEQYLDSHHSSWGAVSDWGDEFSRFRILAPTPTLEYRTVYSTTNGMSTPLVQKIKFKEGVTNSVTTSFVLNDSLKAEISAAFKEVDLSMSNSVTQTLTKFTTTTTGLTEFDRDFTIPGNSSLEVAQLQGQYGPFTITTQNVRIVAK